MLSIMLQGDPPAVCFSSQSSPTNRNNNEIVSLTVLHPNHFKTVSSLCLMIYYKCLTLFIVEKPLTVYSSYIMACIYSLNAIN